MPFTLPKYQHRSRILFDYAITGRVDGEDVAVPLLAGQTADYPYLRETGQAKDRVDFTDQAGEQSLSAWWYRSQNSFHGGTQWPDELFLDDTRDEEVFTRYADSCGVYPFTVGRLRLLNKAVRVRAITGRSYMATVSAGGVEGTVVAHQSGANIVLTLVQDGSASDVGTIAGRTLRGMCSDGGALHVLHSNGITRVVIGTWTAADSWTGGTDGDGAIAFVKDRLVVARGPRLYEITDLDGSGAFPAPIYTSSVSTTVTVAIDSGPDLIYVAQASGSVSTILGIGLDQGSDPPTLAAPVPVGELPSGEQVLSMMVYLGSLLVVGSSRGVRIGVVQDGGSLNIGPLSVRSDSGVTSVHAVQDFVAAAGAKHREMQPDGGFAERKGLYLIDLRTRESNQFRFAYSTWLTQPGSSWGPHVVGGIASLGQSDKTVWSVDGDGIFASTSDYVDLGYLTTGKIRYNTLENKTFSFIRTTNSTGPGAIAVEAAYEDEQFTPVASWQTDDIRGLEDTAPGTDPHLFMQLRFTLVKSGSTTPVLTGYQVKALPANAVPRKVRLVALCFERETDTNGNTLERPTLERVRAFEALESAGRVVLFQDLATGEDHFCTIESVQLVSQHISEGRARGGREGLLLLTLRLLGG